MSQSKESPAGSAGLVAEIDAIIHAPLIDPNKTTLQAIQIVRSVLQRARDRIVELESSGDVVEISTLLALKSQFAAQQERIVDLETELAAAQARAEKAERDTKRLDWLDANPSLTIRSGKQHIRPLIDATMNTRVSEEKT